MRYAIYTLSDPRNGNVRYVGCCLTTRWVARYWKHLYEDAYNKKKKEWVDELLALGMKPKIREIDTATYEDWEEKERLWVRHFRSANCDLLNLTDGGKGPTGIIVSEETRRKLQSLRHSEETKDKIRKKLIGKPKSEEHRRKLSLAKKGRPLTENQKASLASARARNPQCMSRYKKGEANGRAILTEKDVREIRNLRGLLSSTVLSGRFGVAPCTIKKIWSRKLWGHVQ